MLGFIFALFVGFSLSTAVEAAPRDGRVVEGAGSITQSGTHTDIHQNSDFLATSWDSFNIAAHESVQAHQPGASSRLLIRVDGGGTGTGGGTNIAGSYTSNGITILENRNGVQFSRGAIVNVGGLLATSSRISGVAGANWQLNGTGGAVVNHGQIVAGAGGAILAAVKVQNTGDITAKGGDVALGAGASFTVDFAGSMVGFEITKAASGASITTTGKIEAQGGIVSLSAQEAQAVRTNVVSVGGVVKATRIERRGGVVYLSGGDEGIAEVSGEVQASRKVQTTGEYVVVKGSAVLRAPEILVGGDFQGKGDVPTSRRTLVEAGALLDAGANGRVPKGRVIVWSDETTWFNGDISAPGGFAEVSGKKTLASVNLAGIDVGDLLLDPADIIIVRFGAVTPLEDSPNGDIAADDTPSGTLTLMAADIDAYEGDLSLAASNTITVNRLITKPMGGLTLDAGGVLTISADITMSAGNLTLTGSAVSLTGNLRNIGNNITITADTGDITITGDITATGAGDIVLTGANIMLGSALTSLTGDEISLTGAINESTDNDSLAIDVRGRLTLNSGINLGSGTLAINARERINLANANTVITAGTFAIKFTNINGVGDAAAGFTIGSTNTLNNLAATSMMPTYTFAAGNPVDCVINTGACILTTTGNANLATADAALASDVSITIDIGTGALTFGGSAMLITITSPEVTITAGAIDLGGRSLTITSNGAALELNLNADITTTGTLNIGALDKTLTLKSTEAELTLAATDISLLSNNNIRFAQSLDLAASGLLTLNSGLNARGLTLGATTGAGRRIRLIPSASGFFTISLSSGTLTINSEITNIVARQPNEIFPTSVSFQTGGGTLVLNADINIAAYTGSGDSTHSFSFGGSFSVSRLLILGGNRTVKTFGNLNYAFNVLDESAILNTETGQGGNDNFTLQAGGTLAFRGDSTNVSTDRTDINLGTGELILTGTDVRNPDDGTLMTQGISLNILNFRLTGKAVTFNGTVATIDRGRATDIQTFAITARGGNITLNGDGINLFSVRLDQLDGSITLDSDTAIVLGRDVTLAADRVFLTGAIGERATPRALTIMTRTSITLNSDIDLGSGNLTLTSGSTLVPADGVTLAGGAVSLTGEIFLGFANHSITITAMGVLTLNDNIDVGDGALTLTGTNGIVLGSTTTEVDRNGVVMVLGAGSITLIGGAVSLTGAIDESTARADDQTGKGGRDSLTITASGVLTLGSSINLGTTGTATSTGTLTITAERISAARITLTAASPISIEFTGANLISVAQGFTVNDVATLGMVTFSPSVAYEPLPPLSCTGIDDCRLGDGATALILPAMLSASRSLTIDAGSLAEITFDGEGAIMISAPTITITARRLFIEDGRALTIIAATGALTVNANIRSVMDMPSAITLTATAGVLTLGGDITGTSNSSTGDISLTGAGGIALTGDITLDGAVISLSGSIAETADSLEIMASGVLTLNDNIALGMGTLILDSTSGISLNGSFGTSFTLTGAAITLTGEIDESGDGKSLTIITSGNIRLNSDISVGGLTLTAGMDGNGDILTDVPRGSTFTTTRPTLTSGNFTLTQDATFAPLSSVPFSLVFVENFLGSLGLNTSHNAQIVHDWMLGAGRSFNLRVLGMGSTITISQNEIDTTPEGQGEVGFFFLTADDISFSSATLTLTASSVSLIGRVSRSGSPNGNLTITAIDVGAGVGFFGDVNLGTGTLRVTSADRISATGSPLFTAGTVDFTLAQDSLAFSTSSLNLSSTTRTLSLTNTTGQIRVDSAITLAGNITLNGMNSSAGDAGVIIDSDITSTGGDIILDDGVGNVRFARNNFADPPRITLTANNIMLNSNVSTSSGRSSTSDGGTTSSFYSDVVLVARNNLTINADFIDVGLGPDNDQGRLELRAVGGSIMHERLTGTGGLEIVARNEVILMQSGVFAADLLSASPDVDEVRIRRLTLTTTTEAAQLVHNWMMAADRTLRLTTPGAITIAQTLLELGAGSLTLNGASIAFTSTDSSTVNAANITLNATPTAAAALILNASSGVLAFGADVANISACSIISIAGACDINNEAIVYYNLTLTGTNGITLASPDFEIDGDVVAITGAITTTATNTNLTINAQQGLTVGAINIGAGALDLEAGLGPDTATGAITFTGNPAIVAASASLGQDVPFVRDAPATFQDDSGTDLVVTGRFFTEDAAEVDPLITWISIEAITQDFSRTGDGLTGVPETINATTSITLDAGGGTIAFAGMGTIMLTAPTITITARSIDLGARSLIIDADSGTITLNLPSITTGGSVTIAAATINFNMGSPTTRLMINAPSLSITRNAPFGTDSTRRIDLISVTTLTLSTATAQTFYGWMADNGRTVSLSSDGEITIAGQAITLGMGGLTLDGATIRFTNTMGGGGLTIMAGAVSLSGAVSSANLPLSITANSGDIMLNDDINLSTGGDLTLVATGSNNIVLGADNITLTGAVIALTGAIDASSSDNYNFTITATGNITLNSDINLGTGLTGGNLTLTAGMGDMVGNIMTLSTPTFMVQTLDLTQDGAFSSRPFADTSVIGTLNIDVQTAQPYADWMRGDNRTLSLTSTGAITIDAQTINLGTGDLTLEGSGIRFTNTAGLTIMAGAVSLTGAMSSTNRQLTITAGGVITLNSNIDTGTANITLRGTDTNIVSEADGNLGIRGIALGGNVVLTGGAVELTGIIDERTAVGGGNHNLRVNADGDIVLNSDITLGTGLDAGELNLRAGDEGTGNITNGSTPRTIMSGILFLRQSGEFGSDLFSSNSRATGAVSLRIRTAVAQTIHPWMVSLGAGNFSLHGVTGVVLTSITAPEFTRNNGMVTLQATTITLGGTLTGTTVSLAANTIAGDGDNLVTIRATTGDIMATGAGGTGVPASASAVTSFRLIQVGAFGTSAPFTFGANVNSLILETGSAQPFYDDWMIDTDTDRSLNLIATSSGADGAITITQTALDLGLGDLSLSGASITFMAGLTITAGEVALTDTMSTNLSLTIRAQNDIMVSIINLGMGALDLRAGLAPGTDQGMGETGAIIFANTPVITASSVRLTQDEQFLPADPAGPVPATFPMLTPEEIEGFYLGGEDSFNNPDWLNVRAFQGLDFEAGEGVSFTLDLTTVNALESITLDASTTGTISFGGMGAITLTAPVITIIAGTIDIGTRSLTITASTGALTLNGLTTITAEELSLTGNTIAGLSSSLTLNVPEVSLILTGTESFTNRAFSSTSVITDLTINTQAEQEYQGWMRATNRNLSIDSRTRITIGVAEIDLGDGTLDMSSPITTYTHASGLTIRVGDFSHSGSFGTADLAFISTPLLVFADGNITLETRFILSNRLELRADEDGDGMGMITASGPRRFRLDAGSVLLQQAMAFDADLFDTVQVSGAVAFRLTRAVDQTIRPWMAGLGSRGFSLRGVDGVVLTSITTGTTALMRSGEIDLRATTITLGAALNGTALVLRADTFAGDSANRVTLIASTGDITATDADGTGDAALADSVTAFTLIQNSAFGELNTLPFTFVDATITAIILSTARRSHIAAGWILRDAL